MNLSEACFRMQRLLTTWKAEPSPNRVENEQALAIVLAASKFVLRQGEAINRLPFEVD